MDNSDIFRKFLVKWMADNWKKNQNAFAEFLGISSCHLSNILTGNKRSSEKARLSICNKLGVDYRNLIRVDLEAKNDSKAPYVKYKDAPEPLDLRIKSMIDDLLEIYKSGDSAKITTIETNLSSLKAMIQMEKHARKRAGLSLQEEDETLMNRPNLKESA
jgi:transcriptional regulator with XRE-family HTH domain